MNDDVIVSWPVSEDGTPIHDTDGCSICALFTTPRDGESRVQWLTRLRDGAFAGSGGRIPTDAVPERPEGYGEPRWSKDWDTCQGTPCETPFSKHQAHGLCHSCHYRATKRAVPDAVAAIGVGLLTGAIVALSVLWP